jgi:hypothetical protein
MIVCDNDIKKRGNYQEKRRGIIRRLIQHRVQPLFFHGRHSRILAVAADAGVLSQLSRRITCVVCHPQIIVLAISFQGTEWSEPPKVQQKAPVKHQLSRGCFVETAGIEFASVRPLSLPKLSYYNDDASGV